MLPPGDLISLLWEKVVQCSHPASKVGDACGGGSVTEQMRAYKFASRALENAGFPGIAVGADMSCRRAALSGKEDLVLGFASFSTHRPRGPRA